MKEFDIHLFNKNRYLAEAGLGSSQAQSLASLIDKSINQIDEDLSYRDLAVAVSIILKEGYGENNVTPFLKVLSEELGEVDDKQLGKDFSEKFDVKAFSRSGKIDIHEIDDIDEAKFESMVKFIEGQGYTVDRKSSTRYYDEEPGERKHYPKIIYKK
jgi:hypothetical protein